jgi:flagellar biosynthesis/type III secretory pathway protein FliH
VAKTLKSIGYQWKKLGDAVLPDFPGIESQLHTEQISEYDRGYAVGHSEGHAEGYQAGLAQALSEQQQILSVLQHSVDETEKLRAHLANDSLQDMAVALHQIFKQVFLHELRTAPELIDSMARLVASTLQAETLVKVMLNPADFKAISSIVTTDALQFLAEDDSLPVGVVRANAGKSMLEIDVAANLEQILADALRSGEMDLSDA